MSQMKVGRIKCLKVKATSLGGHANRSWFPGDLDHMSEHIL